MPHASAPPEYGGGRRTGSVRRPPVFFVLMPVLLSRVLPIEERHDLGAGTRIAGAKQAAAHAAGDTVHIAPRHGLIAPFRHIGKGMLTGTETD